MTGALFLRLDKRPALGADDLQYAVKEFENGKRQFARQGTADAAGLAALRKDFEAFKAARK
jgi:hypothetical protein